MLIYAAMAKGQSQFLTLPDLSLHTQTMLVLLPMFCDAVFKTEKVENGTLVTIDGVGLENS